MESIVIISGLSGSGKSSAIKALEDKGLYCVDNLPVTLLPVFIDLCKESKETMKIGVGIDVRGGEFLKSFTEVLNKLKKADYQVNIVYLESDIDSLLTRFSETRRTHPLTQSGSLLKGIEQERILLEPIKKEADKIIDTSNYNVHQLKRIISEYISELTISNKLTINIVSFGFKHGILYEADIIMDVRFMPNPNFIDDMKDLTGEDQKVADYVLKSEDGVGFMRRFMDLINFLLPRYVYEGKSYLTIAIGCTGGRHRSVAISNAVAKQIKAGEYSFKVFHRDKEKAYN